VSENEVLRRILRPKKVEVTGGRRILHNKEVHNMRSSPLSGPIKEKHIMTKYSSLLKKDSAPYCRQRGLLELSLFLFCVFQTRTKTKVDAIPPVDYVYFGSKLYREKEKHSILEFKT
jgi:hypothetical protein